jgi:hypothetical protein
MVGKCLLVVLAVAVAGATPAYAQIVPPRNIVISVVADGGATQEFRIDVFETGVVSYHGRSYVKASGSHSYKVAPATVQALLRDLRDAGLFEASPRVGEAERGRALSIFLGVYDQGRTQAIGYQEATNPELHNQLLSILERHVPTRKLRCPFDQPRSPAFATGGDVCGLYDANGTK